LDLKHALRRAVFIGSVISCQYAGMTSVVDLQ
jgi:hypothetical protein